MDDKWIYGSQPDQIFSTIVEGRPNGMPSFRGKLPDYQVWQLAAYVRSLSGQAPKDAAPGRDDDMQDGHAREFNASSAARKFATFPNHDEYLQTHRPAVRHSGVGRCDGVRRRPVGGEPCGHSGRAA